jgi:hypothetical protein
MCGEGEFGPSCLLPDGGVPPQGCGSGELTSSCLADGGMPPRVCGDGEFGQSCVGDGGVPPLPGLCTDPTINTEPEILAGYSPANGASVAENGQVKVWVTDEWPPIISMNEQVDPTTGRITQAGDRTSRAADGYLWEPALYIAPLTAESGGTAHFPQYIKGTYNNGLPGHGGGPHKVLPTGVGQGPAIDPPPAGASLSDKYSGEFVWDVSALGLAPGTYVAEFVIHDGDTDRAVGCVTITITK